MAKFTGYALDTAGKTITIYCACGNFHRARRAERKYLKAQTLYSPGDPCLFGKCCGCCEKYPAEFALAIDRLIAHLRRQDDV